MSPRSATRGLSRHARAALIISRTGGTTRIRLLNQAELPRNPRTPSILVQEIDSQYAPACRGNRKVKRAQALKKSDGEKCGHK